MAAEVLINPKIWQACAGKLVAIPTVNSLVYYFPYGHFVDADYYEIQWEEANISILCRVFRVEFFESPLSHRVYVKITLNPVSNNSVPNQSANGFEDGIQVSSARILNEDDLDGLDDNFTFAEPVIPPMEPGHNEQTLRVSDIQGQIWTFNRNEQGIFDGWIQFVNAKNLQVGSAIFFMKKINSADIYVGIRPNMTRAGTLQSDIVFEAFWAAQNQNTFVVEYYPNHKFPWFDYIVEKDVVDASVSINWHIGMKVKIDLEINHVIRTYKGEVLSLSEEDSPWELLHVEWENPDGAIPNFVSPWQVTLDID